MLSCWQSAEGEKPSLRLLMEHAITQLVSGSLFYWEVQGVIVQDFEGIHVDGRCVIIHVPQRMH